MSSSLVNHRIARHDVLGSWVDAMDRDSFLEDLAAWVDSAQPRLILNHNAHSLALFREDAAFAALYGLADRIFIDGMSVVAILRCYGLDVTTEQRLAVLDWIAPMLTLASSQGWRVVHIGSGGQHLQKAVEWVNAVAPGVDFTAIDGFFDHERGSRGDDQVVETLHRRRPHVLLLGMGMPVQEHWLYRHLDVLPACVVITVGGVLGFMGEARPLPPRWLGPVGLEWAYRLATEPRRLWRRYLWEPRALVRPFLGELAHRRFH